MAAGKTCWNSPGTGLNKRLGEALVPLLVGGIGELVGGNEEHIGPLQQSVDGNDRRAKLLPLQGGLRALLGLGLVRRGPEFLQQVLQFVQLGLEAVPALDDPGSHFRKLARNVTQLGILGLIVGDDLGDELDLLGPEIERSGKLGDLLVAREQRLLGRRRRIGRRLLVAPTARRQVTP